jgi:hypothetical protein
MPRRKMTSCKDLYTFPSLTSLEAFLTRAARKAADPGVGWLCEKCSQYHYGLPEQRPPQIGKENGK